MRDRFDKIDAELAKIRETTVAISTQARRRDATTDKLRSLHKCIRDLAYPGVFDDLRSAGIGTPDQINRLEDACNDLGLLRTPRWNNLEFKS